MASLRSIIQKGGPFNFKEATEEGRFKGRWLKAISGRPKSHPSLSRDPTPKAQSSTTVR